MVAAVGIGPGDLQLPHGRRWRQSKKGSARCRVLVGVVVVAVVVVVDDVFDVCFLTLLIRPSLVGKVQVFESLEAVN